MHVALAAKIVGKEDAKIASVLNVKKGRAQKRKQNTFSTQLPHARTHYTAHTHSPATTERHKASER